VLALARSTLRTRRAAFAGAFLAIALAVTLVYAMGQIMTAGLTSPGPGRFAAADAVVTKHASVQFGSGEDAEHVPVAPAPRLSDADVARIAALPGIDAAVGDLAFPATLGHRALEAHGWGSAALTPSHLTAGHAPRADRELVADVRLGLHPGQRVRVGTPDGAHTFRVSGVARSAIALPAAAPAVFFADSAAPTLAATPGAVNAIAVRGDVDGLDDALGDAYDVLDHRHAADADAAHPRSEQRVELIAAMGSGGGITIMIAVFVVASTLGFAIAQRRREIALLRAVGATPRQIRRMIAGEALLLSLAAAVVGLAAGVPLAGWLGGQLRDGGVAPADLVVPHHWIAALTAVATAVVVAQLAVLVAARRASRIAAGEALLEAAVEPRTPGRWRALLGLVSLAGAGALLILSFGASPALVPAFSVPGALCAAIGFALLAPVLLARPAAALARVLSVPGGAGWWLAAAETLAARRRVGAVAAPILLVVALAGTQAFVDATDRAVVRADTQARVNADAVLVGDVLPTTLAAQARALPGVHAATGVLSTKVYLVGHGISNVQDADTAVGLEGAARSTLDLGVTEGSLRDVRATAVAISDLVAQRNGGLHVGDVLRARLADTTPVHLRVAAIYTHSFGLGDVVLDRAVAVRHAGTRTDDAVFVDGDRAVLARLAAEHPGVRVLDRPAYFAGVRSGIEDDAWITWLVVGLAAIYAAIAVVNTIVMAVSQRRPELALVRLAGATPRQALAMVRNEAIATTLVAVAVGGAVAAAAGLGVARAYPGGHLAIVPLIAVGIVAGAVLVGISSATVAARIALRRPPRPYPV
jgi:putative ABC transport system permease protein